MSVKVSQLLLFANGQFAAFDEGGKQIPEIAAKTAIELVAEYHGHGGFDFNGCEFSTQRPDGEGLKGKIELLLDGYSENWNQG